MGSGKNKIQRYKKTVNYFSNKISFLNQKNRLKTVLMRKIHHSSFLRNLIELTVKIRTPIRMSFIDIL